jgi:hypothetical protein
LFYKNKSLKSERSSIQSSNTQSERQHFLFKFKINPEHNKVGKRKSTKRRNFARRTSNGLDFLPDPGYFSQALGTSPRPRVPLTGPGYLSQAPGTSHRPWVPLPGPGYLSQVLGTYPRPWVPLPGPGYLYQWEKGTLTLVNILRRPPGQIDNCP